MQRQTQDYIGPGGGRQRWDIAQSLLSRIIAAMRYVPALLLVLTAWAQDEARITRDSLRKTVEFLAADDMKGRKAGTAEAKRAAEFMATEFEKAGLKKGAGNGYLHPFPWNKSEAYNVVGVLEGETDEFVVIGAHHDGIGSRGDVVYNGADDNASGCAVLLEVARALKGKKPRRSIVLVSFDAEEAGMVGSGKFVDSGLFDMSRCIGMVCLDLIGGNFLPTETTSLYALGIEYSPDMLDLLKRQPKIEGLDVQPAGVYIIEPLGALAARSDYTNFRRKNVPFIFFSTGTPWYYHQPEDDLAQINFDKLERAARYVYRFTLALANAEKRPQFVKSPEPSLEDARFFQGKLKAIVDKPKEAGARDADVPRFKEMLKKVDAIVNAGTMTRQDKKTLQNAMVLIFELASRKPR